MLGRWLDEPIEESPYYASGMRDEFVHTLESESVAAGFEQLVIDEDDKVE